MIEEEFDFLFSFAGEDREEVERIKEKLYKKYNIFYDLDIQSKLIGEDLYRYLREQYKFHGKYVVCFLSDHYYKKQWTNLEFTAIKERLMMTFFFSDFLIPILLDDTSITEDIPYFIGYYKHENTEKTCDYLEEKIEKSINEDLYIDNFDNFKKLLLNMIKNKLNLFNSKNNKNNSVIKILNKEYTLNSISVIPNNSLGLYKKNEKIENVVPDILITWSLTKSIEFSIYKFSKIQKSIEKNVI